MTGKISDWIKEIFKTLASKFNISFQYRKKLDGPGRGKKIKEYLKKKENQIGSKGLIGEFEMKMIDQIQSVVNNQPDLPKEFYDLNKKIIENIRFY